MLGQRLHVKSATGLTCDGRECVAAQEVNDALYIGTRMRAKAARAGDVDAQAVEALIAMGIAVVAVMQRASVPLTVEQAAERLAWDPAVARQGHAMLEADLSGFLVVEDRTAVVVDGETLADQERRIQWLRLDAARMAAGMIDLATGEMRPEFVPVGKKK